MKHRRKILSIFIIVLIVLTLTLPSIAIAEDNNNDTVQPGIISPFKIKDPTTKYLINYYLNGGWNNKDNPSFYTNFDSVTLKDPKRTGYSFKGWYGDSTFNKKINEIEQGSIGNKSVYAKWSPNNYTIYFDGNGHTSGSVDTIKAKYDNSYLLNKNNFIKEGYAFTGWNTKADGSGRYFSDGEIVSNLSKIPGEAIILYAQWIEQEGMLSDYERTRLINFDNRLPEGYVPHNLVNAKDLFVDTATVDSSSIQINYEVGTQLKKLFQTAYNEGIDAKFHINSAYRSQNTQWSMWNKKLRKNSHYADDPYTNPVGVMPGDASEHCAGLAVDLASSTNRKESSSFGETEEGKWIKDNAYRFGFIFRYPANKSYITGVKYEPWHFRYVGVALATEIYQNGYCLEEYYDKQGL